MTDYLSHAFTILFVTLGPLKVIPVFYVLMREADSAYRRSVAVRAFVVATALVFFIALNVHGELKTWQVSVDALLIAGGIILFLSALRNILGPAFDEPSLKATAAEAEDRSAHPALRLLGKPVLTPIVVPTIVTPAGVVAILFLIDGSQSDLSLYHNVLTMLALMMVLSLIGMLLAAPIMRFIGVGILQLVGWVFSVLQAGLAVQTILEALRRLNIIP